MWILPYAFAFVLFVHGFAHLVGFVVFWRLSELEEMPYKTTLFGGRIDVGDSGIRAVGVVWLLTALAFFACAGALVLSLAWWLPATLATTVFSLLLCISGWPDSRYGVVANVLILAILLAHGWVGWPPVAVQ